eukprot:GFUD01044494.1.p1 GENE.GFUD01044494.1~~GFUD01044494.1.p1  ORF type:complete len:634 (+),score=180.58 GFUD01044494.1:55-1956(+)
MVLKGTKALMVWCQRVTSGYPSVKITNMTSSWRNGLGFCAIIHHHCPDLLNFYSLDQDDVFDNNYLAFKVAEEQLGIPSLLDPEDMLECQTLDKLSILTYLAQYYKAMHNPVALQLRLHESFKTMSKTTDKSANKAPIINLTNDDHITPDEPAETNKTPSKLAMTIKPPDKLAKTFETPSDLGMNSNSPGKLAVTPGKLAVTSKIPDEVNPVPLKLPLYEKSSPMTKQAMATTKTSRQCDLCLVCSLPVYILERGGVAGGATLHRACARCAQCGDKLGVDSVAGSSTYRLGRGHRLCNMCATGGEVNSQGDDDNQKKEKSDENTTQQEAGVLSSVEKSQQSANTTQMISNYPVHVPPQPQELRKAPPKPQELRKAPPKPARTFLTERNLPGDITSTSNSASTTIPISSSNISSSSITAAALPSPSCKSKTGENYSKERSQSDEIDATIYNTPKLLNQELLDLEIQITGLVKQGVEMEKIIRKLMNGDDTNLDERKDDLLIIHLFDLVEEKNELLRKQSEVMLIKKGKRLEAEQAECEKKVRVLLDMSEGNKTDSDAMEEERLINIKLELVKKRNEIVNTLEMDRIRELEENSAVLDVRSNFRQHEAEDLQTTEKKTKKLPLRKRLLSLTTKRY